MRATDQAQAHRPRLSLLCECDDLHCEDRIELTSTDYELLPLEPPGLALVSGHRPGDSAAGKDE